jgi:hypothetical protein
MIKAGDKVRFLNAVGGGTVRSVINKTMVMVEDYDGFEIPTLISELVVIDDSLPMSSGSGEPKRRTITPVVEQPVKKEQPKAEPKYITGKDTPSCFMVFVPQNESNPVDGELKVYLVNDSNNFVLYNYSHLKDQIYRSIESGKMNPNSKRYLESFTRMDLNELPEFQFQLVFFKEESFRLEEPVVKRLKLNPVRFYRQNSYVKTKYFTANAIITSLLESDLEAELEKLTDPEINQVIQEKDTPKVVVKKAETPDLVEVDLHIHELLEDTRSLTNHEMLEVQLGRFRNELETAIANGTRRIVFIHGIGNGTLKQELRKELSSKYKKYYFQDASFKEYGYGATMVILKNV